MSKPKKKKMFEATLEPPKSELFRVVSDQYITGGFLGDDEELSPDFEFYNEKVKRSQNLNEYKFTNYISKNISPDIKLRIQELASDLTIVQNDVEPVRRNDKIDKCLGLYIDLSQETDPYLFKSRLRTSVGVLTPVRVFTKADLVRRDDGKNKALFRIVLIDPFHLVIPSEHDGMTKEQMEDRVFKQNMNNKDCMSDLLKSWFE